MLSGCHQVLFSPIICCLETYWRRNSFLLIYFFLLGRSRDWWNKRWKGYPRRKRRSRTFGVACKYLERKGNHSKTWQWITITQERECFRYRPEKSEEIPPENYCLGNVDIKESASGDFNIVLFLIMEKAFKCEFRRWDMQELQEITHRIYLLTKMGEEGEDWQQGTGTTWYSFLPEFRNQYLGSISYLSKKNLSQEYSISCIWHMD